MNNINKSNNHKIKIAHNNAEKDQSVTNQPNNQSHKRKTINQPTLKANPKSIKNRKVHPTKTPKKTNPKITKKNTKSTKKDSLTSKSKPPLNIPKDFLALKTLLEFCQQHNSEIIHNREQTLSTANYFFEQKNYETAFIEYIVLYFRLRDFDERDNHRSFPNLKAKALEGAILSYYEKNQELSKNSSSTNNTPQDKEKTHTFLKLEISYLVQLFLESEKNNYLLNNILEIYKEKLDYIQKIIEETEFTLDKNLPQKINTSNTLDKTTTLSTPTEVEISIDSASSNRKSMNNFANTNQINNIK